MDLGAGLVEWWELAAMLAGYVVALLVMGTAVSLAQRIQSERVRTVALALALLTCMAALLVVGHLVLGDSFFPFSFLILVVLLLVGWAAKVMGEAGRRVRAGPTRPRASLVGPLRPG